MRFASFSLFASVLACFALAGTSRAAQTYELGSLELQSLTQDWGEPHSNKSVDCRELSIGGRKFERGLGTHAVSTFRLNLNGTGEKFQAAVGVDDEIGQRGSIIINADRRLKLFAR